MTKRFAASFVAITLIMAAASGGAFAQRVAHLNDGSKPANTSKWMGENGTASYYGPGYHGRLAADGSRFDQTLLTAAHPWLPFGSRVKVTVADTGRTVVVTITDRLYSTSRIVDLSVAAARKLGMIQRGLTKVSLNPA